MKAATGDWPVTRTARDGRTYRIRPIAPTDAAHERQFILGLSEESRFLRLMYCMREPSAAFVEQMINVDYLRNMALVAVTQIGADEHFIGVARYAADEGATEAEFAVVVADAWHGKGVGSTLARMLFEYAAAHGITAVYGTVFSDNDAMLGLVKHLGMMLEPHADARLRTARLRTG